LAGTGAAGRNLGRRAAPCAVTLCASSRGRPWSQDGFSTSWQRLRVSLEQSGAIGPGLTLYGLRHTVGTILAEMGFDDRTIADALGQSTEAMARHYSKRANRKRKMGGVVIEFDEELNRRGTETVKPD
jgi:integrase